MEEDIEIIVDIETLALCRLCISNKGKFQIVKQMQRNLKECFDISIHSYDGMSQIICEICKKLVTEIVEVRERFKKNQEILTQKRQRLVTDEEEKTFPVIAESKSEINGDSKKEEIPAEIKVKEVVENETKPDTKNEVSSKIKLNLQKNTPSESPITISLDSDSGGSSKKSSNKAKRSRLKKLFSDSENSDDDNIKLKTFQKSFKYACRVCDDSFNTKTKMNSHITSEHNNLFNIVISQCIPCSVLLHNVTFSEQKPDEWVRLKPSKILKFTPSDPLYYLVKSAKPKVIIDSSSSDSDSSVSKPSYRRIMTKPKVKVIQDKYPEKLGNSAKNLLKEVRTKASKLSSMFSSNGEKVAPADTVVSYPTVSVNSDSDSLATPPESLKDNGVPCKMPLTEEQINQVIEICYRKSKNKKSLTAPIKKDWLIKDIIEYDVINTIWINSLTVKVSRITSSGKQIENVDSLSQLPLYSAEKTSGCLAHRKLEKAPPPSDKKPSPLASSMKEQKPQASKSPLIITVPPVQAVKRSMPSLDDIPNKKVPKDAPQMSPIIISTVSLAKTSEPCAVTQPPANNKPMIKCKPTSLLMPSPVKENVNTANSIYNPYNVNQPDTVAGPSSGLIQQNGLLSSIENNQNNISTSLNFDGYNITLHNEPNSNIIIMNSGQQTAPQVLNNSLMGPVETQPLLSSSNLYQNDESQVYMTPGDATQQSLYQYSSVNGAPGSEYVDINAQLPLPNINVNNPDKASIVTQLIQRCKRENVTLKTSLSVPTKYCKLLRFVLTIKEKQCDTRILVSSEFIVEVCMQIDGVFVLNVSDHSKSIDLNEWSNEFQSELINALKKPEFIQTMRKVGKNFAFAQNVYLFATTLERFEVNYSLLNHS